MAPYARVPVASSELELHENRPIRIAAGDRILCLSGRIWITVGGQAADFVLRPGAEFVAPDSGLTLIEAFGSESARARIESAVREPGRGIGREAAAIAVRFGARLSATAARLLPRLGRI